MGAVTVFAIEAPRLDELRRGRHLRRLVDVLVGRKDPAEVGIAAPVPALPLPWTGLEQLLVSFTRPADRWGADLHLYYLQTIKHPTRAAGYWPPESVLWTLSSWQRLAEELLRRRGLRLAPPVRSAPFPYLSRGNVEHASAPVLSPDTVLGSREALVAALAEAGAGLGQGARPAAEAAWGLLAAMTEAMGPQLPGGRPGERWGLVLVGDQPLAVEKPLREAPPPLSTRPLGQPDGRPQLALPERAAGPPHPAPPPRPTPPPRPAPAFSLPGGLDLDDPDSVVAYVQECAEQQRVDNPGQYHPADHFDALIQRAGDQGQAIRDALHRACTTLLRDSRDSKVVDLVYHLTSGGPPRDFFVVLADRLERDDLPPPGPPLGKDLRKEFLGQAWRPVVAADPELRPRFRALVEAAGDRELLLDMALVADPEGALLDLLQGIDLDRRTCRRLAMGLARYQPERLEELTAFFAAAGPDPLAFWADGLQRAVPDWVAAHRELLG